MARQISLVQQVRIATPCPASWDAMTGDDRIRFCRQCKLNVYNLSAMTPEEGERLIREKEGRICARIYRRADGTILTQDCPVGLSALKRKTKLVLAKIAAAVVFVAGGFTFAKTDMPKSNRRYSLAQLEPIASINRWLDPTPPQQGVWFAGRARVNFSAPDGLALIEKLKKSGVPIRAGSDSADPAKMILFDHD